MTLFLISRLLKVEVSVSWHPSFSVGGASIIFILAIIRKVNALKVIYHPLYGMINYVLIWGD